MIHEESILSKNYHGSGDFPSFVWEKLRLYSPVWKGRHFELKLVSENFVR